MERLLASQKRFQVLALPTGVGKSLVAMTNALFTGRRTLILTSTKGLQDQYLRDYGDSGLVDVRGMNNYPCELVKPEKLPCSEGPCLDGEQCWLREKGCHYFDQVRRAAAAPLVISNYSYWMTQKKVGRNVLGHFDTIVCDEAHEAPEEVSGFLRVVLDPTAPPQADLRLPSHGEGLAIEDWREWAGQEQARLEPLEQQYPRGHVHRQFKRMREELSRLASCGDDWIPQRGQRGWEFEPLWPTTYAGEWLWGDIPHVILMSATIRPKTLEQLGLQKPDYDWIECPSPFPVWRRPIIHVPVARLSRKTDQGTWLTWVDRIDQIIEGRLDRKGIIHTVSYDRAQFLLQHSQYAAIMMVHTNKTTRATVEQFKSSDAPAVLVSPSVHTGYDFPHELARYQIIGKMPFPVTSSGIARARQQADPDYSKYVAFTKLQQAAGRGNRAPDDYCETFVLDDSVKMVWHYKDYVSKWFLDAFRSAPCVPAPAEIPA